MTSTLLDWLREQTADWAPSVVGVFREESPHDWPLTADSPSDLRDQLSKTGHLLPLPSEPAALANVMEIELRQHLARAAQEQPDIEITEGTERSYPDLEIAGAAFGEGTSAVDIKCARRNRSGTGLNNRIALYTGNTYFLWPQLKVQRHSQALRRLPGAPVDRRRIHLREGSSRTDRRCTGRRSRDLADRLAQAGLRH